MAFTKLLELIMTYSKKSDKISTKTNRVAGIKKNLIVF